MPPVPPNTEGGDVHRDDAHPVVVVGAGQAGLATGYFLREFDVDFTILARDERVGDTWRERWDSLRLFTPAFFNGLPGMDFPAEHPDYLPRKDEVADYLASYAERFDLPVQLETEVTRIRRGNDAYRLRTSRGPVEARAVVVATGAFQHPNLPAFAGDLPEEIFQCHSSGYENPAQLRAGDAMIVGAGNSGTQIATEIAEAKPDSAHVWLAGPDTGRLPRRLLGLDVYRYLVPTVFRARRDSFLGRRLYEKLSAGGDPVFKTEHRKMREAGVERIGRITDHEHGVLIDEDGDRYETPNVVWCTGFRPEFSWIDPIESSSDGYPRHERGVAADCPGLYFVGLRWLWTGSSSLIGGVGRDAKHIAETIRDRLRDHSAATSSPAAPNAG